MLCYRRPYIKSAKTVIISILTIDLSIGVELQDLLDNVTLQHRCWDIKNQKDKLASDILSYVLL